MRDTSSRKHNDSALSEVIGFVLILGLIAIVASLYLTYGVPAQGREDEITHMNVIKDEFIGYKLSLDSLFTNKQVGLTMSDSFTLGTKGAFTEGMMSIVPVMNPASSGGIIAINQRTTVPETLNISSYSLMYDPSLPSIAFSPGSQPPSNPSPPSELKLFLDTSTTGLSDVTVPYMANLTGGTTNPPVWQFIANLTPRYTLTKYARYTYTGWQTGISETWYQEYIYDHTDVAITVLKGGNKTLDNYIVYSNIQSTPANYSINVLDDAYGLKSVIGNETIILTVSNSSSPVKPAGTIKFTYKEKSFNTSIPLGAVEYRSQNNYWIDQNYYYQLGGVFLSQTDGNTSYKLPPEITLSYNNVSNLDTSKNIVTVNINALTIDPNNRGVVGGNSPVQLKSRLANITPLPYAYTPNSANTKWIRIGVDTPDPQAQTMWKNYFNYIATVAGVPNFNVTQSGSEVYIRIRGLCDDDVTTCASPDINVIASQAIYSETIHGIGGTVQ